ncbi:MAG: PAS domain-containing protein [Chloroflexi bacterium]|nr:PAS domain-containing protein [Chloroflexota bacterium]
MILEGEQVLYINEQASALLGYSSEQIKQMRVANLVAPLGKFAVQQIGQLSLETDNIPAEIEFWVEKQDGAQSFINFRLLTASN